MILRAIGAYGRATNEHDWHAGRDFRVFGTSTYFSIRDVALLRGEGYTKIHFIGHDGRMAFAITL